MIDGTLWPKTGPPTTFFFARQKDRFQREGSLADRDLAKSASQPATTSSRRTQAQTDREQPSTVQHTAGHTMPAFPTSYVLPQISISRLDFDFPFPNTILSNTIIPIIPDTIPFPFNPIILLKYPISITPRTTYTPPQPVCQQYSRTYK